MGRERVSGRREETVIIIACYFCCLFTSLVVCLQALLFVYKPCCLFTSLVVCLQALLFVYSYGDDSDDSTEDSSVSVTSSIPNFFEKQFRKRRKASN